MKVKETQETNAVKGGKTKTSITRTMNTPSGVIFTQRFSTTGRVRLIVSYRKLAGKFTPGSRVHYLASYQVPGIQYAVAP